MEDYDIEENQAWQMRIIQAYQNSVKNEIIQMLHVYNSLSTLQLSDALKKSKSTILRNIAELIELKIVEVQEQTSPGAYDKRVYSLRSTDFIVKGQELADQILENPQIALAYNTYQITSYTGLVNILEKSVDYLNSMREKIKDNILDPDKILKLLRLNLGSLKSSYMNKKKLAELYNITQDGFDDKYNEYLKIELILPIKHLIEATTTGEFDTEKNIWFYED